MNLRGIGVQALDFVVDTELLEGFPIAVGTDGLQSEHGVGSRDFPTRAAAFQAITVVRCPSRWWRGGGTDHRHPRVVLGDDPLLPLFRRIGSRLLLANARAAPAI